MWNKDEIKGKGKQISGAIKDKTGELIKDPKLEAKGEADRIAGKLQEKSGKARRKTGEAVQKAGKAIAGKLCGCKPGEDNKCCKSEYKVVKLRDEHKASESFAWVTPELMPPVMEENHIAAYLTDRSDDQVAIIPSPPLISEDIFIINRVFRI